MYISAQLRCPPGFYSRGDDCLGETLDLKSSDKISYVLLLKLDEIFLTLKEREIKINEF